MEIRLEDLYRLIGEKVVIIAKLEEELRRMQEKIQILEESLAKQEIQDASRNDS
jgi:uncharacterized coiled-coil protein SlyX